MDNSNIRITQQNIRQKGRLANFVAINIPWHLAQKYKIGKETFLEFEDTGDGIKIIPISFVNKFS